MTISIFLYATPHERMPRAEAKRFLSAFEEQFQRNPHSFHRLCLDDILDPIANVALAEENGRVCAGVIYDHISEVDGSTTLHFKAFFADGSVVGAGRYLVTKVVLAENEKRQTLCSGSANIRIMPDGRCNKAAARSFYRLGFHSDESCKAEVLGDYADKHLLETAEEGNIFRYLKLFADPKEINQKAQDIVSNFETAMKGRTNE